MFGEAPTGSDGGTAGAGEIVTISAGDAFNDAELAQAGELSGQGGGRAFSLQPVSIEGITGLNVAAGIASISPKCVA